MPQIPVFHTENDMILLICLIVLTHWPLVDLNEILDISHFQVNFSKWWLRYLLWNCPHVIVTGLYWLKFNICLGDGLVPSGNKPLPKPM